MSLQLFKFGTSGSWLFDSRVLASRERSIDKQDYPNPVCSLVMKPQWQLVALLISSVHKPWLQNVCDKDEETIHRADDQTIKTGFGFFFPSERDSDEHWIDMFDRGGICGKQEFIFCSLLCVYRGTADQLHKVLLSVKSLKSCFHSVICAGLLFPVLNSKRVTEKLPSEIQTTYK